MLSVSGSIDSLDIAGVVTGSGHFEVTKTLVDVAQVSLADAPLLTISLSQLQLGVGVSGVGVTLTATSIDVALLAAADGRSWLGIAAHGLGGSITVGSAFSAQLSGIDLLVNRAGTGSAALDWSQVAEVSTAIKALTTEIVSVSGSVDSLDVAGLVSGSAHFAVTKTLVDIASVSLTDASLVTVSLSQLHLAVGTDSVGVEITGGSLDVAVLGAADGRSWLGIAAHDLGGSIDVGAAFSAQISSVEVLVNRSSTGTALDWSGVSEVSTAIKALTTEVLSVSGSVDSLDIAGVVTGSGHFEVTKQLVDVASVSLTDAPLLTVTLSQLSLGVGVSGVGVTLTATSIDVALLAAADGRSWLGIAAHGLGGSITVGAAFSAQLSGIDLLVNRAGTGSAALDWSQVAEVSTAIKALTTGIVSVSGSVDSLDIAGLVSGSAHFEVTKQLVDMASVSLTDGSLLTVSLSSLHLAVGTDSAGVQIDGGSVDVAVLGAADGRSWLGIAAHDLSGSIDAGSAFSADISHVDVLVNRSSTGTALDWSQVSEVSDDLQALTTEILSVSGSVDSLDIAGLVTGSAHFEVTKQLVDVASLSLTDAPLLTVTLTQLQLAVGSGDVGVQITGTSIDVATLAAADGRSWLGIAAHGLGGSIAVGSAFSAQLSSVEVLVNRSSTGTALNWSGVAEVSTAIKALTTEVLSVSGSVDSLDIAGVVSGSAHFAVTKTLVDVDLPADQGPDLVDASLLTVSLSELQLSVGTADVGLQITGGSIDVAVLAPKPDAVADTRGWLAISATNLSGTVGLGPVLTATLTGVDVVVNRATGLHGAVAASVLDWSTVPGVTAAVAALAGELVSVTGTLESLSIADGFVTGAAHFEVSQESVPVTLADGSYTGKLLTIALSSLQLSIGTDSVGFELTSGDLTVGVLSTPSTTVGVTDTRSWVGVLGSGLAGSLSLGPVLTASLENVAFGFNRFSGQRGTTLATALDWATALTAPPAGFDTLTDGFSVSGDLTELSIADGFVTGAAHFEVERSTVPVTIAADPTGDLVGASLLSVSLSGLQLHVGTDTVGFAITSGDVTVALLTAASPTAPATDTRYWVGVRASGLAGSLALGSLASASLANVAFSFNRAAGQYHSGTTTVLATTLDWKTALVDADRPAGFDTLADGLSVSGDLVGLDLAGFLTGSAHFAVTSRTVSVTLPDTTVLTGASLLTISLSSISLTFGTDDVNVKITGGSLTVASVSQGTRSWLGINASGLAGSIKVGTIATATLSGIAVLRNTAGVGETPLAWSTALGSAAPTSLAGVSGDQLHVSGQVDSLDVAGLLSGSAHFDVSRTFVNANLPTTGSTPSILLTFTLTNLFLAVGTPSIGAQITGGSLLIASLGVVDPADHRSWVALSGTDFAASLVLPGVSADVEDLTISINKGTGAAALDWDAALGAAKPLDLSGDKLETSAHLVNLDLFGLLTGSAKFSISRQTVDADLNGDGTVDLAGATLDHLRPRPERRGRPAARRHLRLRADDLRRHRSTSRPWPRRSRATRAAGSRCRRPASARRSPSPTRSARRSPTSPSPSTARAAARRRSTGTRSLGAGTTWSAAPRSRSSGDVLAVIRRRSPTCTSPASSAAARTSS